MKIPAKGFTHGGKFHADDVFATALLMIVRPDIKVTRGFVVPDGFDGIVYDVGCGMFDHHQEPRESRPNGVPYAAFGLLWRVLGAQLVGTHQARLLDENFVQPLDLNDNTGEQNSLADAIGSFNPVGFRRRFRCLLLARRALCQAGAGKRDCRSQRRKPRGRDRPERLQELQGRHCGPAGLHALEKRPVQNRCPVCCLPQPARRLQRPVRDRLQDPPQQVPFPPAWGGQPEEILREKERPGSQVLPPQPFPLSPRKPKRMPLRHAAVPLRAAGRPVSAQ